MDIRERILEAARQVYAQHGFRGATTRSSAPEPGVNEVSLFRLFGSKAALFEAVMQLHVSQSPVPLLPDDPVAPQLEITRWCEAVLAHMNANRSLLRTTMGELEERPGAAVSMCEGPNCSAMLLTDYVLRLQATGVVETDADIHTAVAMLMSSLFGDALCRDIIPNSFPQPAEEAPQRYVRTFLRALGARAASVAPPKVARRKVSAG